MRARLVAPVLTVACLLVLNGCGTSTSQNPDDQAPQQASVGETEKVTAMADAKQVAVAEETMIVDGRDPSGDPAVLMEEGVRLSAGNAVAQFGVNGQAYRFCIVNSPTGAWAAYDSAQGRVIGSGASADGQCQSLATG